MTDEVVTPEVTKPALIVRLNRATVLAELEVDEIIGLQEGVIRTMRDVLSRYSFDTDTGEKLDPAVAVKIIGKMTIAKLAEASESFLRELENAAVPPK